MPSLNTWKTKMDGKEVCTKVTKQLSLLFIIALSSLLISQPYVQYTIMCTGCVAPI